MGKRIIPPQDPARLKLVMDERARMFGVRPPPEGFPLPPPTRQPAPLLDTDHG